MRTDAEIKRDVETELRWNPAIDATDVAVAVKDGVVTLTGFMKSYSQKWEAEEAAKSIAGVAAVANDIEVRLPIFNQRPDPEIARDAVAAIQNRLPYSSDHIRVVVRDGWVALEGSIEWNYQRERAEEAVRYLRGVKGVASFIQHYCRQSCVYVSSLICANYGIRLQANQHPAPKPVTHICLFTANPGCTFFRKQFEDRANSALNFLVWVDYNFVVVADEPNWQRKPELASVRLIELAAMEARADNM